MHRLSLLVLLLPLAQAYGQEQPISPRHGAEQVLAALGDDDPERLARLAGREDPDPWLVADALCLDGKHEAAATFARATLKHAPLRADVAGLPAYVKARREQVPPPALLEALRGQAVEPLEAVRDKGDLFYRARVQQALALACRAAGRPEECAAAWRESARLAEEVGWLSAANDALFQAGLAARRLYRFKDMLEVWGRQAELSDRRGHPLLRARCHLNIGSVHGELGDFRKALDHYALARSALERSPRALAELLQNVGLAHHRRGDFRRAQATFERALEVATEAEDTVRRGMIQMLYAATLQELGTLQGAVSRLEESLATFREHGISQGVGECLGNLGVVLELMGKHEAGLAHYEQALEVLEKGHAPLSVAIAIANVGSAQYKLGNTEEARKLQEDALRRVQELGDPFFECDVRLHLAITLDTLGELRASRLHFGQSIELADRLSAARLLFDAHAALARSQLASGDPRGAIESSRAAVDEIARMIAGLATGQGAEARAAHAEGFSVGMRAALAARDPAAFCYFAESGRAGSLLESLEGRDAIRAAAIPEKLRLKEEEARRAEAIARIAYKETLQKGEVRRSVIRRRQDELAAAREGVQAIVERIQREARGGAILYPVAADLDRLRGRLNAGDALVLYSVLGNDGAALVVTTEDARLVRLDAIGKLEVDLDSLGTLRKALVDPLDLPRSTKRLLVSPDGALFRVPFPAIVSDECAVALVPSGTTYGLLLAQKDRHGREVLAVGDAEVEELARLSASRLEAESIGDKVLLGTAATKQGVVAALGNRKRWRAVHFACHGKLDPDRPMFSTLSLTGSGLTALDVFQTSIPADLVVLSACESGRGKVYRGEGMVGLTRAFMFAGAPRVVVSLWKVDDEATKALMVRFYELWNPKDGSSGLPTATALRKAQEFVRDHPDHPKWKHPYYWAAWELWGLPD